MPTPNSRRVAALPGDGPAAPAWTGDPSDDVNHVCGHHLRSQCSGCGSCTTCDACYCGEDDGWSGADQRREQEHYHDHDEHRPGCGWCEREKDLSAGYTRCQTCATAYPEGRFSARWHSPPTCRTLPVIPADYDWAALLGRRVEFLGEQYSITGRIRAEQPLPAPGEPTPVLRFDREDVGYEDEIDVLILPRTWREIRVLD
ncbi:hypothetical protein ACIOGZ_29860 [Kitasatospora sp. NPDC088160]|uniref:hypothetical protein n=1 Tax=Kitasatospora sp. NPDC088160 TaxID=3364072 RepID=UPI00381EE319